MKRLAKFGPSVLALLLLIIVFAVQVNRVDAFKSSAMRFVPVEAAGFLAIPNLSGFIDHGLSDINEIMRIAIGEPDFDPVVAIVPSPTGLPSQCFTLRKSSDLALNGIVAHSSFSLAGMDAGYRVALQLTDDGVGFAFLTDLLFPAYAQIRYESETAETANGQAKYRFEFKAESKNAELCLKPEWKPKTTDSPIVIESATDKVFLPFRFGKSITSVGTVPEIDLKCTVTKNGGLAKPCGCEIVEQGLGDAQGRPARRTVCGQNALSKRKDDLSSWAAALRKGDTVMIGNQYVAEIDGFHLIDILPGGASKRGKYRISAPVASIAGDDSLLPRLNEIANSGSRSGATIFAGVRPGSIASGNDRASGLPMYLLTPIGVHFSGNQIRLDMISNLEPQDSAIAQIVAAASKPETSDRGWGNWRKTLGGKLSDSSLKLYANFLRSYFFDIDTNIAAQAPLAQVAVDIMEQGASSVVVAVNEFYSTANIARLAIAVPDIDRENAGSIVSRSRRQSILRQAKFVVEKASELAKKRGVEPQNLEDAVRDLYCPSPLWRLKSLVVRHGDSPSSVKVQPKIAIDEKVFSSESAKSDWSRSAMGFSFLRILPPADRNVALWGNAYVNDKGIVQSDAAEIQINIKAFGESLDEFTVNLNANPNDLGPVLNQMGTLLEQAKVLESKRDFARRSGLVASLEEIRAGTNIDAVLAKVAELKGRFNKGADLSLLEGADIKLLCDATEGKLDDTPLAFYDDKANVLFVVDTPETISKLSASSSSRDVDGKLLLGLETPQLATLLKANNIIKEDYTKYFVQFPFAKVELVLNGRETGTGIAARLSFSRIQNP